MNAIVLHHDGFALSAAEHAAQHLVRIADMACDPQRTCGAVDRAVLAWLVDQDLALSGASTPAAGLGWSSSAGRAAELVAAMLPGWRLGISSRGAVLTPPALRARVAVEASAPTAGRALLGAAFMALLQDCLAAATSREVLAHG